MGRFEDTLSVNIGGETVRVMSEESAEHIYLIAEYVNKLINGFKIKKGSNVPSNLILVYATLNLCRELFMEREKNEALEKELEATKRELDDFLSVFSVDAGKRKPTSYLTGNKGEKEVNE